MRIFDWKGVEIDVGRSRGGVLAVRNWNENLVRGAVEPWPSESLVQKLYKSKHEDAFDAEDLKAVTSKLGYYCDLQSIRSEDAVNWSVFGPLSYQAPEAQARFANWLLGKAGIQADSVHAKISLWRRIPHPDKLVPGGPELDALIHGDKSVVFVEAKWMSGEGKGQGAEGDKGQMQLRKEYFEKFGKQVYGDLEFVVLGLALDTSDLEAGKVESSMVKNAFLTWSDVAEYDGHPAKAELQAYLKWKEEHSRKK